MCVVDPHSIGDTDRLSYIVTLLPTPKPNPKHPERSRYRAQAVATNTPLPGPVSSTVTAYDYNAGSGMMAALNDGRALVMQLEIQALHEAQREIDRDNAIRLYSHLVPTVIGSEPTVGRFSHSSNKTENQNGTHRHLFHLRACIRYLSRWLAGTIRTLRSVH